MAPSILPRCPPGDHSAEAAPPSQISSHPACQFVAWPTQGEQIRPARTLSARLAKARDPTRATSNLRPPIALLWCESCTPWWATALSPDRARPGASRPEVEHAGIPPRTASASGVAPRGVRMLGDTGIGLGELLKIRTSYSLGTRRKGGGRHLGGGGISDNVRTPPRRDGTGCRDALIDGAACRGKVKAATQPAGDCTPPARVDGRATMSAVPRHLRQVSHMFDACGAPK